MKSFDKKIFANYIYIVSISIIFLLTAFINFIYGLVQKNKNQVIGLGGSYQVTLLLLIFGILGLLVFLKNKNTVEENLKKLKNSNELQRAKKEFVAPNTVEYKKLKVRISDNYIYSYSQSMIVIPIRKIISVEQSKVRGSYDKHKYIIIRTIDKMQYYIAPVYFIGSKKEFNKLYEKIEFIARGKNNH